MARSFNHLIDFLLSEIALCGDQGASPSDVLTFIDAFYKRLAQDGVSDASGASQHRTPVINRAFQEKVWSWLTRNPEVSIGKDRQWNHLTLTEVEERLSGGSTTNEQDAPTVDSPVAPDTEAKSPQSEDCEVPRVFVSEERTWFALTGHGPDATRVLPTEFALLSIIASRKSRGIVQTELVRLSGQDKRSVPKRTDVLQQKGYIEKRAIQVKSARTSLCTLRKFVHMKPAFDATETPADAEADSKEEILDFKVFTDKLFEILREYNVIARIDLKRILGFNDFWRWKILSRALRKFERIGVVKRVRAVSQYADTMKALHPCVMLIREPSEKDIQLFIDDSRNLFSNLEQEGNASVEPDDDLRGEEDRTGTSGSQDVGVVTKEGLQEGGRMLPTWSPDRNVYNLIFETIDAAGTTGKTNIETIRACFGGFFRRPLENALARLVECWQISQPPHLRHLALVRDTVLNRTITLYVHYSARNFRKLVDAGNASWEAVEFIPRDAKSGKIEVPPIDVVPEVDEFGFPLDNPSKDLFRNGHVTLLECTIAAKPDDYFRSRSDPVAVMLGDGRYVVRDGKQKLPHGALERLKTPAKPRGRRPGIRTEGISDTPEETLLPQGRDVPEMDLDDAELAMIMPKTVKPPKLSKYDPARYPGMSEKEMLEAMGLDESWTEHNIVTMERPHSGVYVTPRGRRRPTGKRRGRPRISQIAVFKSPKLRSLPWFLEELSEVSVAQVNDPGVEDEHVAATPVPIPRAASQTAPTATPIVGTSRDAAITTSSNKRAFSERDVEGTAAPPSAKRRRGRPPKKKQIEAPASVDTQETTIASDQPMLDANAEKENTEEQIADHPPEPVSPQSGRKRGRPKKDAGGKAQDTRQIIENKDKNGVSDVTEEVPPQSPVEETQPHKRPRISTTAEIPKSSPEPPPEPVDTAEPMQVNDAEAEMPTGVTLPTEKEGQAETPGAVEIIETNTPEVREEVPNPVEPAALEAAPETAPDGPPETVPEAAPETAPEEAPEAPELEVLTKVESAIGNEGVMDTPNETSGMDRGPTEEPPDVGDGETRKAMGRRRKMKKFRIEKGGSVAMLRRKIVMSVIEQAGGAYPLGTELWYPFTTAWLKTKYTERPDLRTIRTTVKHMVDAGKLRQMTFSGMDDKGIMVTKTMIIKSDLPADDPLIGDLQKKMLAAGSRFYFPPNVEIDPELTKSGNKFTPARRQRTVTTLPVREDITVQLHQKPAFVVAQEQRRGRMIQRRLLRGDTEHDSSRSPRRKERVKRLMKIQRTVNEEDAFFSKLTSISRPGPIGTGGRRHQAPRPDGQTPPQALQPRKMKRIWHRISSMAPHAMLMKPLQRFNSLTGTFSTDAGLAAHPRHGFKETPWTSLPHSVDDIIARSRRNKVDLTAEIDPRSRKFFRDTDAIARWEIENEQLFERPSDDLRYINQTVNGSFDIVPVEGEIRFDFDQPVLHSARAPRSQRVLRPPRPIPRLPSASSWDSGSQERNVRFWTVPPQNRRLSKLDESATAEEAGPERPQGRKSRFSTRRNRFIKALPDDFARKITTAMVVVRTLAGGIEGRMIDWDLVPKAFPGYDPQFIQDRGKAILNRTRLQMAKMQSDFQERFIEAYENDEVPAIDYSNLSSYDWEWIVNWADGQLDIPTSDQTLLELPATRNQFDRLFEIRTEPPTSLEEIYSHNTSTVTLLRKRTLFANMPFAIPLHQPHSGTSQRRTELAQLEMVKTWVRANVITPEETYRPADARQALERFGERLVRDAVQSLVMERSISMGNKGRIAPGRNYDITDHFLAMLSRRRPIDSTQLKIAARFKTAVLDKEFRQQTHHEVSYAAEDGEILVLINLLAEGRITLRPRDPPRDKYGLTDGGYLTRLIDKGKLRFAIEAHPVYGKYVYGNPIREKSSTVPPPRGDMDRDIIDRPAMPSPMQWTLRPFPGRIPVWFDVHRNFIKRVWDLSAATVIGIVALRPGISAASIASMVKPSMGAWEVELLLEWMEQVSVVRHETPCQDKLQAAVEQDRERENEPAVIPKNLYLYFGLISTDSLDLSPH
ncbi:TFIIIC transcription initiation factor complex subunits Tfc3 [Paecilomyces variotii No. 5]|uniref:TFIIIC transcription initiation factor complex subunits Tfc3 n=1 Tax=Byssochlamys spectabilis (strain No. 5 / NBRC 109023) TaxID=1356009 RepID=V5FID5_BYSSN|nr:TFIIIC transcription initiation factor complex subunits Tfc3 [Paecilomyces variotii No. 5]